MSLRDSRPGRLQGRATSATTRPAPSAARDHLVLAFITLCPRNDRYPWLGGRAATPGVAKAPQPPGGTTGGGPLVPRTDGGPQNPPISQGINRGLSPNGLQGRGKTWFARRETRCRAAGVGLRQNDKGNRGAGFQPAPLSPP